MMVLVRKLSLLLLLLLILSFFEVAILRHAVVACAAQAAAAAHLDRLQICLLSVILWKCILLSCLTEVR